MMLTIKIDLDSLDFFDENGTDVADILEDMSERYFFGKTLGKGDGVAKLTSDQQPGNWQFTVD